MLNSQIETWYTSKTVKESLLIYLNPELLNLLNTAGHWRNYSWSCRLHQ